MRAIGIERFGDTPELRELPVPEPAWGQVQVAIEAAAINPLDMAIASGSLRTLGEYRFPLTLGMDGAGTVTAIGGGITEYRVGDRVFGQFWSQPLEFGTFAEVCVVQEAPAFGALAAIPDDIPSQVAAALPTSGMTALGAIDHHMCPRAAHCSSSAPRAASAPSSCRPRPPVGSRSSQRPPPTSPIRYEDSAPTRSSSAASSRSRRL
ncbi:alcohol dehydrogenase catalytic domain-containing protein [Streptomyces malaysiensis subsp. malaysiensis]